MPPLDTERSVVLLVVGMFYKSWMWIIHAPLSNIFTLSPALWPRFNTRVFNCDTDVHNIWRRPRLVPIQNVDNALVGASKRGCLLQILYELMHIDVKIEFLYWTHPSCLHTVCCVQRQMKIYDRWNLKSRFFCIFWISAQPARKSRDTSIRTFLKSTVTTFLLLFLCILAYLTTSFYVHIYSNI